MRSFLLVCMVAAAGCSDEAAAPPDGEPAVARRAQSTACDILTLADAKAALGRDDVRNLKADGGPAGLDICQYGYQGDALADMGNVSVTVQPLDLGSVRKAAEDQGYRLDPVAGVGDAAYYSADIGLYVGKGNRTAIYLLGANGMSDARERSIALARATQARL